MYTEFSVWMTGNGELN